MIMLSNRHSRHLHVKPFLFNYWLGVFPFYYIKRTFKFSKSVDRKCSLQKRPGRMLVAGPEGTESWCYLWKVTLDFHRISQPCPRAVPNFHTPWKSLGFHPWFLEPRNYPFQQGWFSSFHLCLQINNNISVGKKGKPNSVGRIATPNQCLLMSCCKDLTVYLMSAFWLTAKLH